MHVVTVCIAAWGMLAAEHNTDPQRFGTCVRVGVEAHAQGVDVPLAVAVAWRESRLDGAAVSSAGAVGPMQVVPRWWCGGGDADGCDIVAAGVGALAALTGRYGVRRGLARHNGGNVPPRASYTYADDVMQVAGELR